MGYLNPIYKQHTYYKGSREISDEITDGFEPLRNFCRVFADQQHEVTHSITTTCIVICGNS